MTIPDPLPHYIIDLLRTCTGPSAAIISTDHLHVATFPPTQRLTCHFEKTTHSLFQTRYHPVSYHPKQHMLCTHYAIVLVETAHAR